MVIQWPGSPPGGGLRQSSTIASLPSSCRDNTKMVFVPKRGSPLLIGLLHEIMDSLQVVQVRRYYFRCSMYAHNRRVVLLPADAKLPSWAKTHLTDLSTIIERTMIKRTQSIRKGPLHPVGCR